MRILVCIFLIILTLVLPSSVRAETSLTKPLASPTSESTPPNTFIINPDPTKCYPTPCTTVTLKKEGETIISPSEVKKVVETISLQKGILPTKIGKIGLTRCEPQPGPEPPCDGSSTVYQIETEKETRFLGIVPFKSKLDYQIDATNGKVLKETKPWYLQIASFLFKF